LDAAGVHVVVAGQALAQVFGDALVRAGVVARPDATVTTAVGAAAELGAAVALAPHAGVALLGVAGRHEGFAAVALAAVAVLVRVAIARACPVALALLPVLIAGIALLGVRAAVALVLLLASLLRVLARRAVLVLRTALPVRLGTRAVPAGFAVVRSLAQRGLAQALLERLPVLALHAAMTPGLRATVIMRCIVIGAVLLAALRPAVLLMAARLVSAMTLRPLLIDLQVARLL